MEAAYKAIKIAKAPENPNCYEKFTNDDYQRLEQVDFRSVRYKKNKMYGDDFEEIGELESGMDDLQDDDPKDEESVNINIAATIKESPQKKTDDNKSTTDQIKNLLNAK